VDGSAAEWFASATSRSADWPVARLLADKHDQRISVVIPARNEEATIAAVVDGIRRELVDRVPLVDELVVMDSDSVDGTADIAAACGATVHPVRAVRPDLGGRPGKGEALWKSLFVTDGDLLVFIDADLTEWGPHFVTGLLGPLLHDPGVQLVKGFYDRILDDGSERQAPQGGRVTELVARPLLNMRWPQLSRVVQPLAGEWAIRRATMSSLPIPVGYGVEMAVLLDVGARYGLGAVAQVDLGRRAHSHQNVHDLGVMAAEILHTAERRAGLPGDDAETGTLWQYDRDTSPPWRGRPVPLAERPPAASVGTSEGAAGAEAR
jgi:glucosyl-3-phosphoglycerate synthase